MKIIFELTMPQANSWNGKWSGEDKSHVIIKNIGISKKRIEKYNKLIGDYYYDFSDGWCASINVRIGQSDECRKLNKINAGFAGYDWMVNSIIDCGEIKIKEKK